jgi:hypothetical protein
MFNHEPPMNLYEGMSTVSIHKMLVLFPWTAFLIFMNAYSTVECGEFRSF